MAEQGSRPRVLLLTDSRGRELEKLLNANQWGLDFRVTMESGATITRIAEKLSLMNKDSVQEFSLISAGICSITKIVYQPSRMAVLRSNEVDKIVSEFEKECLHLIENARAITHVPVMLSPIVGIDMIAYAGHYNALLYAQQPIVDNTVAQVNRLIREANMQNGLPTPNTSYCIHRNKGKGKGYRSHYIKLYDGCHPNEEVKANWVKAILNCCSRYFSLN